MIGFGRSVGLGCLLAAVFYLAHLVYAKDGAREVEVLKGVYLSYPTNWAPASEQVNNAFDLVAPAEAVHAGVPKARINITAEPRIDHAEAVQRLHEIVDGLKVGTGSAPSLVLIRGWPALQHQYMLPVPVSEHDEPRKGQEPTGKRAVSRRITIAEAVANKVILIEATFSLDAPPSLVRDVQTIARTLRTAEPSDPAQSEKDLRLLRRPLPAPASPRRNLGSGTAASSQAALPSIGAADGVVTPTFGEVEIAVSNDGQDVVLPIDASTVQFSNTFGRSFASVGAIANQCGSGGDPSIAWGPNGAPSGVFYYAYLRDSTCSGANRDTVGIAVSNNHGQTFAFRSNAVPLVVAGPDQEHVAADPRVVPGDKDQVYVVYRNLAGPNMQRSLMTCSADSGLTWSVPAQVGAADGDFPRVAVGTDGFVYVVNRSSSTTAITISKFAPCANNPTLLPVPGMPRIVDRVSDSPVCPIPGLDRCNNGNTMSSWMVAIDDTNANHVYIAFAKNSRPGYEDILVRDSFNGGFVWSGPLAISSGTAAHRYMSWICVTGGTAFVSWYDQSASATGGRNDLTDYMLGSAPGQGASLHASPVINLSRNPDAQCRTGFPCGSSLNNDLSICGLPPTPGGGCPKYGDYNGNACAAGRVFNAWASATAPPYLAPVAGISVFFATTIVVYPPELLVPLQSLAWY